MKTPREILLQHHEVTDAKLTQIRRDVIAELAKPVAMRSEWLPLRALLKLWLELIWPARRTWAGLAVAWVFIVVVNVEVASPGPGARRTFTPPSPATLMALREQERQFTELTEPGRSREADRPKPTAPRPRSQARFEFLLA